MFFNSIALITALLAGTSMAGETVWDGSFTDTTAADLDKWSWSNQVGAYQWYIHGSGATSDYVNIDGDDARLTIDSTASWNGQNMMRTELIPQTTAAINKGKKFYHFSVKHTGENAPDATAEHQVAFFESHFTELKYGASGSKQLQWFANSKSQFDIDFEAGIWHNVAYGIDFDANTVEFFHSTGADELVSKAGPVDASVSSNGADWHVGVLRLPGSEATEDWYFSGVYIEDGDLTTSISGSDSTSSGSDSSSAAPASSAAAPASSSAAPASSSVAAVSSQAAVVSTSQAAAVETSSVAAAPSSAAPVVSSSSAASSAVPTTLQTLIRSSSSVAATSAPAVETSAAATSAAAVSSAPAVETSAAATSTSASEAAPAQTEEAGSCAIEYVYV